MQLLNVLLIGLFSLKMIIACPDVDTKAKSCGSNTICGYLPRPIDPANPVASPTIYIYYRWRLRNNITMPAVGTLLAMSGGPGYGMYCTQRLKSSLNH